MIKLAIQNGRIGAIQHMNKEMDYYQRVLTSQGRDRNHCKLPIIINIIFKFPPNNCGGGS